MVDVNQLVITEVAQITAFNNLWRIRVYYG